VLGEATVSAARTDTFLGERYLRIARRRGKKRAIVAIGRSILVIIWALLSDTEAQFVDLGADYYAARNNPAWNGTTRRSESSSARARSSRPTGPAPAAIAAISTTTLAPARRPLSSARPCGAERNSTCRCAARGARTTPAEGPASPRRSGTARRAWRAGARRERRQCAR
jgi:hypothetical protein